ncbi:MAG TPA: hypothetical protein PKD86_06680 [Gemmatales bacterium]|nr:hypothetical protein [Gemmatales bacterium]HMP59022.1 hypothetical protein [Gemmatales bacterium]
MFRPQRLILLAALLALLGSSRGVKAQDLPSAESILDRYVEVTGGKEAYLKLKNRVIQGRMEMPAAGINGPFTMRQEGRKMRMTMELPGIGKVEQFADGKKAGEVNTITGARLFEGEEKTLTLIQANIHAEVDWRESFPKVKCVGTKTVNGKECYEVEMETADGIKMTRFFDRKDGLLVAERMRYKGQMGEMEVETLHDNYKKFDGISMPTVMNMKMMGQEFTMKIDRVEHNVKLAADAFDLPAELK